MQVDTEDDAWTSRRDNDVETWLPETKTKGSLADLVVPQRIRSSHAALMPDPTTLGSVPTYLLRLLRPPPASSACFGRSPTSSASMPDPAAPMLDTVAPGHVTTCLLRSLRPPAMLSSRTARVVAEAGSTREMEAATSKHGQRELGGMGGGGVRASIDLVSS